MKVTIIFSDGRKSIRNNIDTIAIEDGYIKMAWDKGTYWLCANRYRVTNIYNKEITIENF